jgi:hypothetical protein
MQEPHFLMDRTFLWAADFRRVFSASIFCIAATFHPLLASSSTQEFEVIAHYILPTGSRGGALRIGGLSGLAWDAKEERLWAVSDSRKWSQSVIFFFRLHLPGLSGEPFWVEPDGFFMLAPGSTNYGPLDVEGIALWNRNRFFISHEGSKDGLLAPGISCYSSKTAKPLFSLPIPPWFFPVPDEAPRGLQENRGFESVAISPCGNVLYAANESPLLQDLPNPLDGTHGPVRILRFDLKNRAAPPSQRPYQPEGDALFGSVVDMIVEKSGSLFVLERQLVFSIAPRQCRIRIFRVHFDDPNATDISGIESLRTQKFHALSKQLVFDSSRDPVMRKVDNIEGMAWGPQLHGFPTLLLVSDDNFRHNQQTEFWLLRVLQPQ